MDRKRLYATDREVIAVWRKHGIPLDRTTVEHASQVVDVLAYELEQAWSIIRQLLDDEDVECTSCRTEVQPSLFVSPAA